MPDHVPFIVIWMDDREKDHWIVFEDRASAKAQYDTAIAEGAKTASIVRPIESTDYDVIGDALRASVNELLDADVYTDAPECQNNIAVMRNDVRTELAALDGSTPKFEDEPPRTDG